MPIPKITKTEARKMKKEDLIFHCFHLQQFIELFDFGKLIKENEEVKEEYEIYKDNAETLKKILYEENRELKKENKKLYDKVKSLEWSQNVHITQKDREIKKLKEKLNQSTTP